MSLLCIISLAAYGGKPVSGNNSSSPLPVGAQVWASALESDTMGAGSGARLPGARLPGARLPGARLSGARLSGARLSGARLSLPSQIYSGEHGKFHVQGIAYDAARQCMYMSFTTALLKFDMQGRLVASVEGLTGHLGCLAMNPDDGRLYGSIEYKHDAIGKGISKGTGTTNSEEDGFYIAIFDLDRLTRQHMDASDVMTTVYIKEALTDYSASVSNNGRQVEHRFGCSGIDGVTFAPAPGKQDGKYLLYVAYGVYGDTERTDNDYQVLLAYDVSRWQRYEQPLSPTNLHKSGPAKPKAKYFAHTGNTTYGIQNLAYDPWTGYILAAVYPGKKPQYPNYGLFAIDISHKARKQKLQGMDDDMKGLVLPVAQGWHFPWGSTGICSLGDCHFYISHNGKKDGLQNTTVHLYRWTDDAERPLQEI